MSVGFSSALKRNWKGIDKKELELELLFFIPKELELELNVKELELELNWKKVIDPSPAQVSAVSVGFAAASNLSSAVAASRCSPEELQLPAPSSFFYADGTVWGRPCGGSWTKGPSESCPCRQASRLDDWLVGDIPPEAARTQDQQESDVIQEDGS